MSGVVPVAAETRTGFRSRVADFMTLAKVRLNLLVVFSTFSGAYLATRGPVDVVLVIHAIVGTVAVSIGASVLNQFTEREVDRLMHRTRDRPLPAGRMNPAEALALGLVASIGGVAYLAAFTNLLTAVLAGLTVVSYVGAYTPLKRRSSLSTLVGAVPGALPAMGGWAAVRGSIGAEAWLLFAIVFFWQLPHFMAIAWRYREDYVRGGMPVLSVFDTEGVLVGRHALFHTTALIPLTLLPSVIGMAGTTYFVTALVLGTLFYATVVGFAWGDRDRWAPRVFRGSILYLAALFTTLLLDKGGLV